MADLSGGHAPSAAPRYRLCRSNRLPFLVHVVRCGADPRRASASNGRDRDLSTGGHPRRPGDRRCTCALQLLAVLALVILSTRLERRRPIVGRGARRVVVPQPRLASRQPHHRPGVARWTDRRAGRAVVLHRWGTASTITKPGERRGSFRHRQRRRCGTRSSSLAATRSPMLVGLLACSSWCTVAEVSLGSSISVHAAARHVGGDDRFRHAHRLDKPPLDLRTSWWIIPSPMPLSACRSSSARWCLCCGRSIPCSTRRRRCWVRRHPRSPRNRCAHRDARPARGRRFAFAVSLGEFGATSFLPDVRRISRADGAVPAALDAR